MDLRSSRRSRIGQGNPGRLPAGGAGAHSRGVGGLFRDHLQRKTELGMQAGLRLHGNGRARSGRHHDRYAARARESARRRQRRPARRLSAHDGTGDRAQRDDGDAGPRDRCGPLCRGAGRRTGGAAVRTRDLPGMSGALPPHGQPVPDVPVSSVPRRAPLSARRRQTRDGSRAGWSRSIGRPPR